MIFSFVSCASLKDAEDLAQDIRVSIIGAGQINADMAVRADYGDEVADFDLHFTGDESSGTITVKAPESVAGFSIIISDGKVNTDFDGVSLYMGEIDELGKTPACAFMTVIEAWKSGYITNSKFELLDGIDTVALTACVDDTCEVRTWFNKDTLLPVHSELLSEGRVVLFCDFSNVVYNAVN